MSPQSSSKSSSKIFSHLFCLIYRYSLQDSPSSTAMTHCPTGTSAGAMCCFVRSDAGQTLKTISTIAFPPFRLSRLGKVAGRILLLFHSVVMSGRNCRTRSIMTGAGVAHQRCSKYTWKSCSASAYLVALEAWHARSKVNVSWMSRLSLPVFTLRPKASI